MPFSRRTVLSLAGIALLPTRLLAADCSPIYSRLALCDGHGWRLDTVAGETATLISDDGLIATLTFRTGQSDEDLMWAGEMAAHAPISARANVLDVAFHQIDGRLAITTAYLPRHFSPPSVVALTAYQGDGATLELSTQSLGATYTDQHRLAHVGLLGALKLDLPE